MHSLYYFKILKIAITKLSILQTKKSKLQVFAFEIINIIYPKQSIFFYSFTIKIKKKEQRAYLLRNHYHLGTIIFQSTASFVSINVQFSVYDFVVAPFFVLSLILSRLFIYT